MTAPTPITGEILVNLGNTINNQGETALVRLSDGFMALYQNQSGGATIIGQRYDTAGLAVGSSFTVTANSNAGQLSGVQLADGTLILGYYNGTGPTFAQFDASGTRLGADTVLIAHGAHPYLTALANGNFVVSWNDPDSQARMQVFTPSGTAVTSVLTTPDVGGTTYAELNPQVDGFSDNGFVLASWDPFTSTGVSVKTFNSSGTVTNNFLIEGSGGQPHAVTVLSND